MPARALWLRLAHRLEPRVEAGAQAVNLHLTDLDQPVRFEVPLDARTPVVIWVGAALPGLVVDADVLPDWPGLSTGDPAFDAATKVLGPDSLLTCLPDAVRGPLARWVAEGAAITDGALRLPADPTITSVDVAAVRLTEAIALVTALAPPAPEALLHRALRDAAPAVRAACRAALLNDRRVSTARVLAALPSAPEADRGAWLAALDPTAPADIRRWLDLAGDDPRWAAQRTALLVRASAADPDSPLADTLAVNLASRLAAGEDSHALDVLLARAGAEPPVAEALAEAIRGAPSPRGIAWLRERAQSPHARVEGPVFSHLMALDPPGALSALRALRPMRRPEARQVVARLLELGVAQAGEALVWWLTERWTHVGDLVGKPVARALSGWLSTHADGGPAKALSGRRLPRDFLDDALKRLEANPPTGGAPWLLGLIGLTDGQRRRLAVVLGQVGDPAAEAWLIEALDGLPALRVAAAQALARCGTRAALSALEPHTGGLFTDGEVKAAARAAVAAIEARPDLAPRGGLSLSGTQVGGLALTGSAPAVAQPDPDRE